MPKMKIEIIYADTDILVVNKPSGVSVTKDRSGKATLSDILTDQLGPETAGSLRLIHRLDKDTSGVMILAKNKAAQSRFSSLFAKRQIKKTYLAIVTGLLSRQRGRINASIVRDDKKPNLMRLSRRKGKKATTQWRVLADFDGTALLAVNPLTSRTHQIRVHLPSIGLPLTIDPLYGRNPNLKLSDFKPSYQLGKKKTEKPLIERLTLHAYQIEFANPNPNQPDYFLAGLDKKFKATIKMLTKHNPNGTEAFLDIKDFDKIINGERLVDSS